MRIGIAFDLVPVLGDGQGPDDRYEEFDKPETIEAIAAVLRSEGHQVALLGDGPDLLRRLLDSPPDFVWNMAEGQGTARSREARVPAVCEMLGIPYFGSDPLALAASLDKEVARRLVASYGVMVPKGVVLNPNPELADDRVRAALVLTCAERADYPILLKPAFEGSSKGIRAHCLAGTESEAVRVFRELARNYQQPILAEQFIEGDEVTVGVLGNGSGTRLIGAMRILPRHGGGRFVYSIEVKRDWQRQVRYETPALISGEVMEQLSGSALAAYRALGCRDVARIDFRIRNGTPYFLEINPLPGLAPVTSDLVILARGYGLSHADLIRRILNVALARVGRLQHEPVAP